MCLSNFANILKRSARMLVIFAFCTYCTCRTKRLFVVLLFVHMPMSMRSDSWNKRTLSPALVTTSSGFTTLNKCENLKENSVFLCEITTGYHLFFNGFLCVELWSSSSFVQIPHWTLHSSLTLFYYLLIIHTRVSLLLLFWYTIRERDCTRRSFVASTLQIVSTLRLQSGSG